MNEIKINKKEINAAAVAAGKAVTAAGKELKEKRNSLNATIDLILKEDGEGAKLFRELLGVKKNNKVGRAIIEKYVIAHYTDAIELQYWSLPEGENDFEHKTSKLVPCTPKGNVKTDYLAIITTQLRECVKRDLKRREIITRAWTLRKKMIEAGTYDMKGKIALANTIGKVPAKFESRTNIVRVARYITD